ncbi:hypothetical protein F511_27371 [Dorcoceras hygrometricum]|uniref:Uncharacterized protein n=1 Tax=Dorcoceras hygrometricum TaxID=472368 RepID=A0A2Z7DCJ9_9LAMI|nr:hypothetical protein F511_27371 [Dorcoceras hygrometricum]
MLCYAMLCSVMLCSDLSKLCLKSVIQYMYKNEEQVEEEEQEQFWGCGLPRWHLCLAPTGITIIRLFSVDCASLRQSGPRTDLRFLRQAALEALTRSARTDSPRLTGRKPISGDDRRRRRRVGGGGGGGLFERGRRRWCLGFRVMRAHAFNQVS